MKVPEMKATGTMEPTMPKIVTDAPEATRLHRLSTAVCATVLCILTLLWSFTLYLSNGAVFTALLDEYNANRAKTAFIGSINEFVFLLTYVPTPALIQRFGLLTAYMLGSVLLVGGLAGNGVAASLDMWIPTHGFAVGMGMGILYMAQLDVIYKFTPRSHRGLCVGLAASAGGFGTMFLSPCLHYLATEYGLPNAMRVLAASAAATLVPVLVGVRMLQQRGHYFKDSANGKSDQCRSTIAASSESGRCQACKSVRGGLMQWFTNIDFLLLFLGSVLYLAGFSVPFVHLASLARDRGVNPADAAGLLSIFGTFNGIGRILFSRLGDLLGGAYLRVYCITVLGNSIMMFLLPWCQSYEHFTAFAACCGLFAGGRPISLVCGELFGQEQASKAYGLLGFAFVFSSLGAPLVGHVYDVIGSYEGGFISVGVLMAASLLILLGLDWKVRRQARDLEEAPREGDRFSV
ncbi:unnamed protein product [Effrenium voratum]|uniref:Major facilitator superfamily (MFS) profile domain-containing protein n=1 Tax=Effrenium voratum TaxID=2562239 RepID=A0AA36MNG6_9DINO|nr:unnamed protein product [Effrenium voratum]